MLSPSPDVVLEGLDQMTPTEDLILAPPILKLAPNARQVVRLALLKPLELSDGSIAENEIEIGWHLAREYWGLGYGTEIGRALVEYGLNGLGIPELHAIAYPENVASIRIMQKIGMEYQGVTDRYYGVVAEHYLIRQSS